MARSDLSRVKTLNGRISELLKTTRFASASELAEAIKHYEKLYNHCIPQKAIGYKTPIVALKKWHKKRPDLFNKKVYDLSGLDNLFIRLLWFFRRYRPATSKPA